MDIYFRYLGFSFAVFAIGEGVVISRRILQGWGVVTTWWILPSGIVISRLILRVLEDYRSSHLLEEDYQGPCLLVEDYQGSCLLLEDYRGFYLFGWRIIELLACLARSAGTSACCRGRI